MQEWYLINNFTSPNMIGGYENQGFQENKDDAFQESLTTDITDTVILYNYDLSESQEIRCIIQGNTADTSLKSMERAILVPIGVLHSGDYIFFEDQYWIVDGRPGNNKIYEKAILKECQYKIRWQKDDGTIVERWSNITSASKYDVGENGNKVVYLSTNNYTVIMPNDKDSWTIEGKRVFIDLSPTPRKVFKITRNDDVLFSHGEKGGTLNLIADKTEFNVNTDNQQLRICDYIELTTTPPLPLDETTILKAEINGSPTINIGFKRLYTVSFTDNENNIVDWAEVNFDWNIISDFAIDYSITNNTIELFVEDDDLIDEKIKLQILIDNVVNNEKVITLSSIWR